MKYWILAIGIVVFVLLMAGCVTIAFLLTPWTPSRSGGSPFPTGPILTTEPTSGGPQTRVTLKGSGFPANSNVTIHLGPPNAGATPNSYADARTDAAGDFSLTFNMPATWPNGQMIAERKIIIVASVNQGESKGLAEFDYGGQDIPPNPNANSGAGGSSMTCAHLGLRPVLIPQYLPVGMKRLALLQCEPDHFLTQYESPTQRLLLGAGAYSAPMIAQAGEHKQVTVRGQLAILQIADKADPAKAVQVWWEEPGQWVLSPDAAPRDGVFYLLSAEGIAPEEMVRIAEGLAPFDLRN